MMLAVGFANDAAVAYDVCLTAHGKHRIIAALSGDIIEYPIVIQNIKL